MNEITKNLPEIAEFSKISRGQWQNDAELWHRLGYTDDEIDQMYDQIELPRRATAGSAGYDFKAPCGFTLEPGEALTIPTGIRVYIEPGWFLGVFPRSSLGFKYGCCFANTIPVVDSDYYKAKNEGHILLRLVNRSDSRYMPGKRMTIRAGDGFAQGVFLQYGVVFNDQATAERVGGIGSTDQNTESPQTGGKSDD